MKKWLGYVDQYSKNGMLARWPDTDYRNWYLGDWAVPKGTDQTDSISVKLVNNTFVAVCYETMEKIAGALGKAGDAEIYKMRKETLRDLIHTTFFKAETGIYGSGSQIDLTYPLLAGIVPGGLIPEVKNSLHRLILETKKGHFATGLVGIPVFTEYAIVNRESDLMYTMLKKTDYPGYLYMIANGATSTWEHWDGARSRIHNCYNGIGSWFIQGPGGIRAAPDSPGYRHILIDPQIPEGLKWANTTKETPYGTVTVRWEIINGNFSMEVHIPPGSKATVAIPSTVKRFRMNRKSYQNDSLNIETGSGKYMFEWEV
jgi:alpha-L-rhamnosidase